MRLRKSKDNELKFCKKIDKDLHMFNFQKFMRYLIEEIKQEKEDEESAEDEMDELDDEQ